MIKTTLINPEKLWPGIAPPLTKQVRAKRVEKPAHKITADGAAAVSPSLHWIPIGPDTPRGVKLQLISSKYRVAHYGPYLPGDGYYTHWYPLPTFTKGAT